MRRYFTDRKEQDISMFTDLAIERRRADIKVRGVDYTSSECDGGIWESVRIYTDEGANSIGRPKGRYDTLNTGRMDLLNEDKIDDATEAIAKKLCEVTDDLGVIPDRILIVGLGNKSLTPDSVGPKTAEIVKPTLHISNIDKESFEDLGCSEIAVITPGVSAETGLDSAEIIRGVTRRVMPDLIIAVDAISTRSPERLGSTVQISDTGIYPGSGVGNTRCALNEDNLGVPTIAIGVPTVIDSRVFRGEGVSKSDAASLIVAPKEIDEISIVAAKIIGSAVNQAFGISIY